MRRLLIVAPHFPSIDTVDSHRVRMNLRHYSASGWAPAVLAVSAAAAARQEDARLLRSLPAEVEVERVGALPEGLARLAGISAVGLRGFCTMARAGDRLIADAVRTGRPFDLAFFSTTAFPAMALGPRWRRRFGLPYVLDLQDPWFTAPAESLQFRRTGLKHCAMRALHRRLEAATAPGAAGLIAVSPRYIEALRGAYPTLRDRPAEAIPFGWSSADIALAREVGRPWTAIEVARRDGSIVALSAGRAGPDVASALRALFRLVAAATPGGVLDRLSFHFLGTGYRASGNPLEVVPIADAEGVTPRIKERPDRLPLLDALASLEAADLLLVLGSNDLAYQPSKLHQYLALPKPVLVIAPLAGPLAHQVKGLTGVIFVAATEGLPTREEVAKVEAELAAALALPPAAFAARREACAPFEAAALAARECELFEAALVADRAWRAAPTRAMEVALG